MNKQRATALGLTAGLLGGGAAGVLLGVPALTSAAGDGVAVVAQQDDGTDDTTDTTDTTTDDTTTDDTTTDDTTAGAGGETDDEADDEATATREPGERIRGALQDLVDDGTITTEQADAVATHLAEQLPARDGHGPGGHGPGGRHGHAAFDGEVVAELLGITPEALRDALRDGSSIAELAQANGVDIQTVIDALVAEAREHLELAVTDGRLTQAEADERLADITERITEMVDRSRPAD